MCCRSQIPGVWLWLGCLNRKGYAQIGLGPKVLRAHRFAFELFRGPLSASLDIDHLCRVRCCVNPHHLEPVTHRENCKRGKLGEKVTGIQKAKTHCPYGHAYTAENTYTTKAGTRQCKACGPMWKRNPRPHGRGGL